MNLEALKSLDINDYNNILTIVCCGIIIIVFINYIKYLWKVRRFNDKLSKLTDSNIFDFLETSKLSPLWNEYKKTFCYEFEGNRKTDIEAEDFFYINTILNSINVNQRTVLSAAGILVGLGLLGTFVGLTFAIYSIDTSSSEHLMASINGLLSGMFTAFLTSILGMSFSTIIIIYEKRWFNRLQKRTELICKTLNEKYYMSRYNMYSEDTKKQNMFLLSLFSYKDSEGKFVRVGNALGNIFNESVKQTDALESLSFKDRDGRIVTPGAALRDIYEESTKQSAALGHFTSDLSEAINNAMETTLSSQLSSKIVPLMEVFSNKLDLLAANIKSPADDMTKAVVEDLKKSMEKMLDGFKSGISSSVTGEMNDLAMKLNKAGDALNGFPESIESMTKSLMGGFEDIRTMVTDISSQSSTANQEALNNMMTELNGAIGNVKNIVTDLSNTAARTSTQAIEQMNEQVSVATSSMTSILSEVKNTVNGINEGHHGLLEQQQKNTLESEELITSFKSGLAQMKDINDQVVNTINQYTLLQTEASKTAQNLSNASGNISVVIEEFKKSQDSYQQGLMHYQTKNQGVIDEISLALEQAKTISTEYVNKFAVIQNGLSSIFEEINTGLNQYNSTVKTSLEDYLSSYSSSLTNATSALSNAMERQNDIVEELVQGLDQLKKNS